MIGERTKVTTLLGKIQQEAHHQRRAKALFGRIDTALDKKRGSHPQCHVEWRDESQIEPVRPFKGDSFAQGTPDRVVGTNTHFDRVGYAVQRLFS